MKISELFYSIQGEGKLAGVPSVFVRTSGCNLRCRWCDTPYTSWHPEGAERTIDQIMHETRRYPTRYAVLTGGEPMIADGVQTLCAELKSAGYHVTIETAATVWQDVTCDLASISPKLANSTPTMRDGGRWAPAHDRARINLETIRRFMAMPDHQLKFVVDAPEDIAEIEDLLHAIGSVDPANVLLMPQGISPKALSDRAGWIVRCCKTRGFRFCPRLQIDLFGNTRGT